MWKTIDSTESVVLIINRAVLVPTYADPADQSALAMIGDSVGSSVAAASSSEFRVLTDGTVDPDSLAELISFREHLLYLFSEEARYRGGQVYVPEGIDRADVNPRPLSPDVPVNGLIGTVIYGRTTYFRRPFRKHTCQSEFSVDGLTHLPRVDILYACADMPADLVDCSVSRGARGIVIAGDGNGNMNAATIASASRAAAQGTVIVRSSRVPTGTVSRNVEIDDDRHQFVVSDELNPAKARILLMLALVRDRSLDALQQLYYAY